MTQAKTNGNADPGIESVLECRIEAALEYQLGRSIAIQGTLHNSGSSAVWILFWNTFLDPEWQDCVLLAHKGSAVPYTGITGFRNAPNRDSYIRIAAGESVSRQIDLSEKYAITEPGDYEVSFYLPILGAVDEGATEPPADERALQLTLVESPKVSFRISGVEATPRNKVEALSTSVTSLQASFPITPMEPLYDGLDKEQKEAMRRAHFTAYRNIFLGLESVQKFPDELYGRFFDAFYSWDSEGPRRRQTVIDTLSAMARLMSTEPKITYAKKNDDPNCSFERLAYTYLNNSRRVFACSNLFNDDFLRFAYWSSAEWGRALAVVHEVSHAAGSTTDDWYAWTMCEALAKYNRDVAVKNAQNYALYVMCREGSNLPTTKTYQVRCYDVKNAFQGWLQSQGNWVCVMGDDQEKPMGTTVYWYKDGGDDYLCPFNTSRYLGDNGNGGQGNTEAAWNLRARRNAVFLQELTGNIGLKSTERQRLSKGDGGRLKWSADATIALKFDFVEL